eukprot:17242-Heterococcus_DN1.PRE.5
MKPTCVGISTARTVLLRNTSRIPLVFSTAVPAELSGVFSVVPTAGTLQGNDSIVLKVAFAPRQSTAYTLKLPMEVRAVTGEAPKLRDARQIGIVAPADILSIVTLKVQAQGTTCAIQLEPAALDYGTCMVNVAKTQLLALITMYSTRQ